MGFLTWAWTGFLRFTRPVYARPRERPSDGSARPRAAGGGLRPVAAQADPEHFAGLLKGVVRRQRDIDPMIDRQLAEGWRLTRIDSIVRAILRAAAFELMELEDVPPRVVISEYIEVAHAFFEGDEPRVVNGVLDSLARKLRPGELPERG